MFALVEGVLLRPLPVADEARLFVGWRALQEPGARRWPFHTRDLDLLRRESRLLEGVAGVGYNDPQERPVVESGTTTLVSTARVTGGFFEVLGASPLLGRTLSAEDDVAGAENVLVVSYGFWQRRYGGSMDVLGRRVLIGEQPFMIVGVMPREVEHPRGVEAWMTVAAMLTTTTNPTFREAAASELDLLARVREGVTVAQARAELRALAPALDAQQERSDLRGMVPMLQPYREHIVGDARPALLTLFAAVALVLLIACANVANLLLVRGESRGPEFAVRAALGASRGRLVRYILTESGVLALAASAVAILATAMALPAVVRLVPDGLPRVDAVRVDAFVALFSVTLAFLVASLAGVAPALATGRLDLTGQLGAASRSRATPATHRSRRLLIVAQVALAVIVLTATGLLARSLQRLQDVGDRLAADRLVHVSLALPQAKYADRELHRRFVTDLAAQLESVPSIAAATPINAVPFTGLGWDAPTFTAEGQSNDRTRTNPTLNLEEIHPSYFRTFEVALVRGRAFTEFDGSETPRVAIVSDDVAARMWAGQDPIGRRLKMGDADSAAPWLTIVGVAAATRYREIREPRPTLYVPAAQMLGAAHDLAIRTTLAAPAVADLVRARVRAMDADVGVMPPRGFDELLDVPLARPRFNAFLITLFGVGALLLAAIGLCTVMMAVVARRRREIGVRVALGATAGDVHRLVLGEGVRLVAAGSIVGVAVAGVTTRLIEGLLFEVRPLDAVSWIGALFLIGAVTMLALYLPVRRASRVDPAAMLRAE